MASDHDESDDEFAGLIAASKVSWSAPAPTRSRKRGRETAVDADDAAPPAARTPAPPREGASPARGATPRGGSAAGRRRSTPTPADVAGSMPPPPPRRVVDASDDASDDETTPIVPDLAPSGPKGRGTSKYYGVGRNRRGGPEWQAKIKLGKQLGYDPPETKFVGRYSTELAAARAVDLYIHEHMPSLSAKANFPRGHVYDIAPPGPMGRGASKYYGVTRNHGRGAKWLAEIYLGKKLGYNPPSKKHIGRYSTELEAAQAIDDYIYANVRGLIPKANFPRDDYVVSFSTTL